MTKPKDLGLIDRLTNEARLGRLSRRAFMRHSVAAGLTTATATGLWTSEAKAQPKSGGAFRVAIHDNNSSDTHNPGTYLSVQQIFLAHTHRSFLTLINTDQTLGGDVAEDWSGSEDASEWTFKMRDNVTFHDGSKVTADDVIASMNFHRGDASTSAAKALLADVVDITKTDDLTVVFKLAGPNADLPWLMTDYHLAILPATEDGIDWESGIGCGPYKIVDGEFGVGFKLERHDGWHLEGAYFDTVEMIAINDPNARQTALVTGDVDAVSAIDLKTMALMQRNPNLLVDNVPSASAITMPMHCDTAPFDDVKVRMALKLAMNRDEIVEKIAFGAAIPGNDFHHSPGPALLSRRARPVGV
ncbi:ABC transporter substrate-binding protein [Phaeobacter sp. J2-8]|uniref:ABC transporter substrate-binding protein n=1 Tax=Phaeobacter sp. J2-8 TaxID=2931394 RepID=UPI001FD3E4DE|nr:ABC transporter substrate-binding protein [Phaeobacter sp. J2-8]MCJ7870920.1 ABC transporter substrate-binding protein [Phaeobacter sp. J2-8]